MRRILIALLGFLVVSSVAIAAGPDDPLTQGIAAYNNSEYEQAENLLGEALAHPEAYDKNDLSEAHRYMAMTQLAFNRSDAAIKSFVQALAYNPDIEYDPDLTSPKILDAFDKAKAVYLAQYAPEPEPTPEPEPEPTPTPEPEPQPAPSQQHTWRWPAGWTCVGIGGTSLIASGVTYYMAWDYKSQYDDENEDQDRADELKKKGESSVIYSIGLASFGAVATGLGIYFLATDHKMMTAWEIDGKQYAVMPVASPRFAGLSFSGEF